MRDMTRPEAIKRLKWFEAYNEEDYCGGDRVQIDGDWYYYVNEDDLAAFEMAIASLETDETYQLAYEKPFDELVADYCKEHGQVIIDKDVWNDIKDYEKPEICEDCISRELAELALTGKDLPEDRNEYIALISKRIQKLPSVLPKAEPLTLEKAIDYLHEIGWMQEHDKAMTESTWESEDKE